MGVVVKKNGKICIAHDMAFDGRPVCMNFHPSEHSMTIVFDDGTQTRIASVTMPEFRKRLQKARSVLLCQLRATGPRQEMEIPLHILMDGGLTGDQLPAM